MIVLVWQHGHGSRAIWGLPATGAITNWVPLIAFAFLYGLSMDYEVFILTRIREERDRTGPPHRPSSRASAAPGGWSPAPPSSCSSPSPPCPPAPKPTSK